jgi:hypothetical protein
MAPDCVGNETKAFVDKALGTDGSVVLLENLRFHKGEVRSLVLIFWLFGFLLSFFLSVFFFLSQPFHFF